MVDSDRWMEEEETMIKKRGDYTTFKCRRPSVLELGGHSVSLSLSFFLSFDESERDLYRLLDVFTISFARGY